MDMTSLEENTKKNQMKKEKQKWLRVGGDDGWQIVIPESDSKPHAVDQEKAKNDEKKRDLAWMDCPCKPKLNYLDKVIVHNSFQDQAKINESMNKIL